MKNIFFYETDIGEIGIEENDDKITNLYFNRMNHPLDIKLQETKLLLEASEQFKSYLKGKLKEFDLPLEPKGTEFMKSVWKALIGIPYGETLSYGEVAQVIGNPKAYRAVGLSNNKNPIPIFIPCHRVVGSKGALVGYLGGLELKAQLLELEKLNK